MNRHISSYIQNMFKHWLELGVDGVLMEGLDALFEMEEFTLDEPEKDNTDAKPVGLLRHDLSSSALTLKMELGKRETLYVKLLSIIRRG